MGEKISTEGGRLSSGDGDGKPFLGQRSYLNIKFYKRKFSLLLRVKRARKAKMRHPCIRGEENGTSLRGGGGKRTCCERGGEKGGRKSMRKRKKKGSFPLEDEGRQRAALTPARGRGVLLEKTFPSEQGAKLSTE